MRQAFSRFSSVSKRRNIMTNKASDNVINQTILNTKLRNEKTKDIILPQGIYFGCFGNPMNHSCNCCNTNEKNLKNYKKYLYHHKHWEQLGLQKNCIQ